MIDLCAKRALRLPQATALPILVSKEELAFKFKNQFKIYLTAKTPFVSAPFDPSTGSGQACSLREPQGLRQGLRQHGRNLENTKNEVSNFGISGFLYEKFGRSLLAP